MKDNRGQKTNTIIAISSQIAAILTNTIIVPFDVIKIRIQASKLYSQYPDIYTQSKSHIIDAKIQTIKSAYQNVVKNEGYYSLFSGAKTNLLLTAAFNLSMFLSYEHLKVWFLQQITKFSENQQILQKKHRKEHISIFCASIVAQTISSTITLPLEYFKTHQQSFKQNNNAEISKLRLVNRRQLQFFTEMYAAYIANLTSNLIFFSVYWPVTEEVRQQIYMGISTYKCQKNEQKDCDNNNTKEYKFQMSSRINQAEEKGLPKFTFGQQFFANVVSGMCGGGLAALASQPFDVIKTRKQLCTLQSDKRNIQIFKEIYSNEGMKGLYSGAVPRLLKLLSYGGLMVSLYEGSFQILQKFSYFGGGNASNESLF